MSKNQNSPAPPENRGSSQAADPSQLNNPPQLNRILAGFSDLEQFATKLHPVRLELGDILYEPEQRIEHVYFPTSGVISLLAAFQDGSTVEAGLLGREGMLGTSVVLGAPIGLAFVPRDAALGEAALRTRGREIPTELRRLPLIERKRPKTK